jgi:hypothetical protein
MRTAWTIIPAALFGLALISEPVMLIPGSYFSGIGETELTRLADATGRTLSEVREHVTRARISEEVEITDGSSAFAFRVRREGYFLVQPAAGATMLNVRYLEPGSNFLQQATTGNSGDSRIHLQSDALIYVEVLESQGVRGSFEISEPLRDADLSRNIKDVIAAGWDQWEFDPLALAMIEPGQPVNGNLRAGGANYYLVEASANTPFRINMESDDFDTYLEMWEVGDAGIIQSHSDDDGAGNQNSMLRIRPDDQTSYLVIKARGYDDDDDGPYQLRLRQPEPRRGGWSVQEVAIEEGLEIGQLRRGALGNREQGFINGGQEVFYVFPDATGEVSIDLMSDDFDTYLEVWAVDTQGGFLSAEDNNDDDGSGQNSRLTFQVGEHSVLLVKVREWSDDEGGSFVLHVR